MSSIDPAAIPPDPVATAAAGARHRRRPPVPKRFFLATLALYALVLGTYLLSGSSLHRAYPNWRTVVPVLAGVSFYVASTLFLLILGRGRVSRWVVLAVVASTFVLTCFICMVLMSPALHAAIDERHALVRAVVGPIASVRRAAFSGGGAVAQSVRFAGMTMVEEAVKLLPVFLLITTGRIRTAHGAMLCGALSGLTFGTVEAVSYGYLLYPQATPAVPVTTYFTRFFVASPLHGIWDALAGGLVFFLSGRWRFNALRRPGWLAYLSAYACAVAVHVAHNSFQKLIGPQTQIVTAFALLAPLYVMARLARRRALAAGEVPDTRVIGDLHLLNLTLATWFIGTSVVFAWVVGLGSK